MSRSWGLCCLQQGASSHKRFTVLKADLKFPAKSHVYGNSGVPLFLQGRAHCSADVCPDSLPFPTLKQWLLGFIQQLIQLAWCPPSFLSPNQMLPFSGDPQCSYLYTEYYCFILIRIPFCFWFRMFDLSMSLPVLAHPAECSLTQDLEEAWLFLAVVLSCLLSAAPHFIELPRQLSKQVCSEVFCKWRTRQCLLNESF